METQATRIRSLIQTIHSTPADHVMQNPTMLWNWGAELGALLSNLSGEMVRAKRAYWVVLQIARKRNKTKVDADIEANNSEEWERSEILRLLYADAREMLMIVKKFMTMVNEERQANRFSY